tara:strand:+ start:9448 stop:10665 length:1218 start_codon:yes stop_codon:yes gene_type:complete
MSENNKEIVIIGGGIVGLTIAYQIIERGISKNIIILEKENNLGLHTSGRNSGVLHAGIYYKPGSLKSKVCIEGAKRLKGWIKDRGLTINPCGKIIIPTKSDQDSQLDLLFQRGIKNGAKVEFIDNKKLNEIQPNTKSITNRALWSPYTTVVNPLEIINQLEIELKDRGVIFIKGSRIKKINKKENKIYTNNNSIFNYKYFFNCAGLQSDRVAHMCNVGKNLTILPFKGLYWKIKKNEEFDIKTNIYPVPDLSVPFLGVHFTPSSDKKNIFIGPTATVAFGRENYKFSEGIEPLMLISNLFILSKQYLMNKNKFRQYVHQQSLQAFEPFLIKSAQNLVPLIQLKDIEISEKIGIRAQLFDNKKMSLEDDFICTNDENSTHVLNAVSPAFTSSFSLADLIINYSKLN